MAKTSLSSGIYSHPEIPLEEHLRRVAEFTDLFLREKRTARDGELQQVCRVIALVHDIGKATGYFQDYLNSANQSPGKRVPFCRRKTSHSFFSAICAYYLIKELNLPNKFYPLFAFLATRRHHSDLVDVRDEVNFDDEDRALLFDQLQSIPAPGFSFLCREIKSLGVPVLLNKEIIAGWIDEFTKNESRELRRVIRNLNGNVENYILLNFIYSLLLDADKSAVVVKRKGPFQRGKLNGVEWVNNFRQKEGFLQSPLNKFRDEIYEKINAPKDVDLNQWVYSLNLPTGMGKTLTAFAFALKLREALKSRYGVAARIIYSLPYLSIIDQNARVLEAVINANIPCVTNDILLRHHHLTDIFYRSREDEFSGDEAEILIEGWNSEIVITTFVQLFHTLISNRKNSIRKFHRLANSILILDEVQSIPIRYWLLLHNVLTALRRQLNVYVIFVTATEPLIFENSEMTPLISEREKYFNILNRVVLKPLIQQEMTLDDLTKCFPLDDDRSYLFIFNTITAAREFYRLLQNRGIKGTCTYLSTHIVPGERLKRINDIKEKKYRVVVSTQLVEAGVDIDFDVVVRDIAPLDSINQSAGRCNRNALGKGEVYVVKLINESGSRTYASYIYDPILLDITENILSGKDEIKESDFLNLVNLYYEQTAQRKSQDESRSLLEAITNLRYYSDEEEITIADFALIEEDYTKIDVFIELDEQAEKVWKEYIALRSITDRFERKRKFEEIKNKFYQYVISIPGSVRNRPEMVGEIGYVKRGLIGDYYSEETGFKPADTKPVVIW